MPIFGDDPILRLQIDVWEWVREEFGQMHLGWGRAEGRREEPHEEFCLAARQNKAHRLVGARIFRLGGRSN